MPRDKIVACVKAIGVAAVLWFAAVGIASYARKEVAPPVPPEPTVDVQAVSAKAWTDFRAEWVDAHEEIAGKADSYKSWQEAFDDAGPRIESAYVDSFRPLGNEIKSGLYGGYDPTDPKAKPPEYDPAKLRDVFTQAAKGAK